jgi:hypothetical protein
MKTAPRALSRGLLVVGFALIVASPAGAFGFIASGDAYGWLRAPAQQTVATGRGVSTCAIIYNGCVDDTSFSAGIAYVPPSGEWVSGYTPGQSVRGSSQILSFNASDLQEDRTIGVGTCGLANEAYAGSGQFVYFACGNATGVSILKYDALANQVSRVFHLPPGSYYGDCRAYDFQRSLVFCFYRPSTPPTNPDGIITGNLTTGLVMDNISVPGMSNLMIYDPLRGALWVTTNQSNGLVLVRPADGRVLARITEPGQIVGMGIDESNRDLYLASAQESDSCEIEVVNDSTIAVVARSSVPSGCGDQTSIAFNPVHGDVFISLGGSNMVAVLNLTAGELVGLSSYRVSANSSSVDDCLEGSSAAISSTGSTLGVAAASECGFALFIMPLSFGLTSPPAFSAAPFIGTDLPIGIAIGGILAGLVVLVIRWAVRPKPPVEDVRYVRTV